MDSKSQRKRQRQIAAQIERERRRQKAEETCPLNREEYTRFIDAVTTEWIESPSQQHPFQHTHSYLETHDLSPEPFLNFLSTQRIQSDFDVIIHGDEHFIFGSTPARLRRMPIDEPQLHELMDYIDIRIRKDGCDNTLRWTEEWLSENSLPVSLTVGSLIALGGGCDCEVILNVEPNMIYPNS